MTDDSPFTPLKVVGLLVSAALVASAQTNKVIPFITQGETSTTWIHVLNACSRTVSYEVWFNGSGGEPQEFSFEGDDGLWTGFHSENMNPNRNHFWTIPKTADDERVGYAEIRSDGDGCVQFDVAYGDEVGGDLAVQFGFVNELSPSGVAQPFIHSTGCDTGVSLVGSGEEVSIEATDWSGSFLGRANLGHVNYMFFLVNNEIPSSSGKDGMIQITGGDVAALGFIICDDQFIWSRRAYSIPGGGSSGEQYEVVSFAAKRIGCGTLLSPA